ncbi:MAG TPA: [protein-PII] uridylyltransferase, partial [Actinophytocola sp.]|nr:[protein-PII] uridylyltransferase [Actinophytocola sp.]
TLDGDPVLLELLHALSEVDALATGPGVWSEWKARLIGDLVARCRRRMAGESHEGPAAIDPAQRALAETVAAAGRPDVMIEGAGALSTITLVAPDRPGLLSRAAGVLALHSLQVHAATLTSHAGAAVDVFTVSPRFGSLPNPALLREHFARAIGGTLELTEKLAAKERDYGGRPADAPEPRALWFDDEAGGENSGAVVLELRAADRIGLLHSVAEALERCGADVLWARATQLGGTAVASFSLAVIGGATPDTQWRRTIERAVLAAC